MHPLQLAFQHSQATRPAAFPEAELYFSLLEAGKSVILCRMTRYCGVTDATLPGRDTSIVAAFSHRDSAVEYWFNHELYSQADPDIDHELWHPLQTDNNRDDLYRPAAGKLCFPNGKEFVDPEFGYLFGVPVFRSNGYVVVDKRHGTAKDLYYGHGWSDDPQKARIYIDWRCAYADALEQTRKGAHCWVCQVTADNNLPAIETTEDPPF